MNLKEQFRTKFVLSCLALFFATQGLSQEVRLSVQTGHSGPINKVIYNSDNTLIASCGRDNKIVIWDLASGKQYASFTGHTGNVTDMEFNSTKDILYASSLDSTVSVWDIHENKQINSFSFDFPIGALALDESTNTLIVAGEALVFYALDSGEEEKVRLLASNRFTALEISPLNNWLAVGGKYERVSYIIDLKKREAISQFFSSVNDFAFAEDEQSVYYASENGGLINYNFHKNTQAGGTNKSEWNSFNSIDISTDYVVGVTDEAEIVLFNRLNWKKELLIKAHLQSVLTVDINEAGDRMITAGVGKKILLWDLANKEHIKTFDSEIYRISQIDFTEDDDEIVIGFANGFVRKTNLHTNNSVSNRLKLSQTQITKGWDYFLTDIAKLENDEVEFNLLFLRASASSEGAYNYLKDVKLKWDMEQNKIEVNEGKGRSEKIKLYERDLKQGIVHTQAFFLDDASLEDETEKLHAKVVGDKLFLVFKTNPERKKTIVLDHSDRITSVAINTKYDFVATASWDGLVKFWNVNTGKLISTFGAFGASDFVYISPENYYFASKRALDNIGFILDERLFSFDQFDLLYNRPDLVFKQLPFIDEETIANYHAAYMKRLSKLGISEEDLELSSHIPELEIKNKTGTTSYDGMLRYDMSAIDEEHSINRIHILANGVPIFGQDGKVANSSKFNESDSIVLTPGRNTLQFFVTNEKGVSSLKHQIEVISKQELSSSLYIASIGCSKFDQDKFDLEYAEKDARNVVDMFKNSKLFSRVNSKLFVDEQVTKESLKGLFEFFKPAQENDVAILFVAGHGVLDANLDYFIATHDMDFSAPQSLGIPMAFFEKVLDKTKSRKKLMFIDACHSGELDKDEVEIDTTEIIHDDDLSFRTVGTSVKNLKDINPFELSKIAFADMRSNNGSTIISSSGGAEYSAEGAKWNNGVFTYSLIQGLVEKKADLNRDGRIMLSEIQVYLTYMVNKLTEGKQTPTSRVENLINDFRLR